MKEKWRYMMKIMVIVCVIGSVTGQRRNFQQQQQQRQQRQQRQQPNNQLTQQQRQRQVQNGGMQTLLGANRNNNNRLTNQQQSTLRNNQRTNMLQRSAANQRQGQGQVSQNNNANQQQRQASLNNNRNQGQSSMNNNQRQGQGFNNNRNQAQYNNRNQGQTGLNNNRNQGQSDLNNNRNQGKVGLNNNNRNQGKAVLNNNRNQGKKSLNNNRNQGQSQGQTGLNSNLNQQQGQASLNNNANRIRGINNNQKPGQGIKSNRNQAQTRLNNNRNQGQASINSNQQQGQVGLNNNRKQAQTGLNSNLNQINNLANQVQGRPGLGNNLNQEQRRGQSGLNNNQQQGRTGLNNVANQIQGQTGQDNNPNYQQGQTGRTTYQPQGQGQGSLGKLQTGINNNLNQASMNNIQQAQAGLNKFANQMQGRTSQDNNPNHQQGQTGRTTNQPQGQGQGSLGKLQTGINNNLNQANINNIQQAQAGLNKFANQMQGQNNNPNQQQGRQGLDNNPNQQQGRQGLDNNPNQQQGRQGLDNNPNQQQGQGGRNNNLNQRQVSLNNNLNQVQGQTSLNNNQNQVQGGGVGLNKHQQQGQTNMNNNFNQNLHQRQTGLNNKLNQPIGQTTLSNNVNQRQSQGQISSNNNVASQWRGQVNTINNIKEQMQGPTSLNNMANERLNSNANQWQEPINGNNNGNQRQDSTSLNNNNNYNEMQDPTRTANQWKDKTHPNHKADQMQETVHLSHNAYQHQQVSSDLNNNTDHWQTPQSMNNNGYLRQGHADQTIANRQPDPASNANQWPHPEHQPWLGQQLQDGPMVALGQERARLRNMDIIRQEQPLQDGRMMNMKDSQALRVGRLDRPILEKQILGRIDAIHGEQHRVGRFDPVGREQPLPQGRFDTTIRQPVAGQVGYSNVDGNNPTIRDRTVDTAGGHNVEGRVDILTTEQHAMDRQRNWEPQHLDGRFGAVGREQQLLNGRIGSSKRDQQSMSGHIGHVTIAQYIQAESVKIPKTQSTDRSTKIGRTDTIYTKTQTGQQSNTDGQFGRVDNIGFEQQAGPAGLEAPAIRGRTLRQRFITDRPIYRVNNKLPPLSPVDLANVEQQITPGRVTRQPQLGGETLATNTRDKQPLGTTNPKQPSAIPVIGRRQFQNVPMETRRGNFDPSLGLDSAIAVERLNVQDASGGLLPSPNRQQQLVGGRMNTFEPALENTGTQPSRESMWSLNREQPPSGRNMNTMDSIGQMVNTRNQVIQPGTEGLATNLKQHLSGGRMNPINPTRQHQSEHMATPGRNVQSSNGYIEAQIPQNNLQREPLGPQIPIDSFSVLPEARPMSNTFQFAEPRGSNRSPVDPHVQLDVGGNNFGQSPVDRRVQLDALPGGGNNYAPSPLGHNGKLSPYRREGVQDQAYPAQQRSLNVITGRALHPSGGLDITAPVDSFHLDPVTNQNNIQQHARMLGQQLTRSSVKDTRPIQERKLQGVQLLPNSPKLPAEIRSLPKIERMLSLLQSTRKQTDPTQQLSLNIGSDINNINQLNAIQQVVSNTNSLNPIKPILIEPITTTSQKNNMNQMYPIYQKQGGPLLSNGNQFEFVYSKADQSVTKSNNLNKSNPKYLEIKQKAPQKKIVNQIDPMYKQSKQRAIDGNKINPTYPESNKRVPEMIIGNQMNPSYNESKQRAFERKLVNHINPMYKESKQREIDTINANQMNPTYLESKQKLPEMINGNQIIPTKPEPKQMAIDTINANQINPTYPEPKQGVPEMINGNQIIPTYPEPKQMAIDTINANQINPTYPEPKQGVPEMNIGNTMNPTYTESKLRAPERFSGNQMNPTYTESKLRAPERFSGNQMNPTYTESKLRAPERFSGKQMNPSYTESKPRAPERFNGNQMNSVYVEPIQRSPVSNIVNEPKINPIYTDSANSLPVSSINSANPESVALNSNMNQLYVEPKQQAPEEIIVGANKPLNPEPQQRPHVSNSGQHMNPTYPEPKRGNQNLSSYQESKQTVSVSSNMNSNYTNYSELTQRSSVGMDRNQTNTIYREPLQREQANNRGSQVYPTYPEPILIAPEMKNMNSNNAMYPESIHRSAGGNNVNGNQTNHVYPASKQSSPISNNMSGSEKNSMYPGPSKTAADVRNSGNRVNTIYPDPKQSAFERINGDRVNAIYSKPKQIAFMANKVDAKNPVYPEPINKAPVIKNMKGNQANSIYPEPKLAPVNNTLNANTSIYQDSIQKVPGNTTGNRTNPDKLSVGTLPATGGGQDLVGTPQVDPTGSRDSLSRLSQQLKQLSQGYQGYDKGRHLGRDPFDQRGPSSYPQARELIHNPAMDQTVHGGAYPADAHLHHDISRRPVDPRLANTFDQYGNPVPYDVHQHNGAYSQTNPLQTQHHQHVLDPYFADPQPSSGQLAYNQPTYVGENGYLQIGYPKDPLSQPTNPLVSGQQPNGQNVNPKPKYQDPNGTLPRDPILDRLPTVQRYPSQNAIDPRLSSAIDPRLSSAIATGRSHIAGSNYPHQHQQGHAAGGTAYPNDPYQPQRQLPLPQMYQNGQYQTGSHLYPPNAFPGMRNPPGGPRQNGQHWTHRQMAPQIQRRPPPPQIMLPYSGSLSNPQPPLHIIPGSPEFIEWLYKMDALGIDTMFDIPDPTDPPPPTTTVQPPSTSLAPTIPPTILPPAPNQGNNANSINKFAAPGPPHQPRHHANVFPHSRVPGHNFQPVPRSHINHQSPISRNYAPIPPARNMRNGSTAPNIGSFDQAMLDAVISSMKHLLGMHQYSQNGVASVGVPPVFAGSFAGINNKPTPPPLTTPGMIEKVIRVNKKTKRKMDVTSTFLSNIPPKSTNITNPHVPVLGLRTGQTQNVATPPVPRLNSAKATSTLTQNLDGTSNIIFQHPASTHASGNATVQTIGAQNSQSVPGLPIVPALSLQPLIVDVLQNHSANHQAPKTSQPPKIPVQPVSNGILNTPQAHLGSPLINPGVHMLNPQHLNVPGGHSAHHQVPRTSQPPNLHAQPVFAGIVNTQRGHQQAPLGSPLMNPNANISNPNANMLTPNANMLNPNANMLNPNANLLNPNANMLNSNANMLNSNANMWNSPTHQQGHLSPNIHMRNPHSPITSVSEHLRKLFGKPELHSPGNVPFNGLQGHMGSLAMNPNMQIAPSRELLQDLFGKARLPNPMARNRLPYMPAAHWPQNSTPGPSNYTTGALTQKLTTYEPHNVTTSGGTSSPSQNSLVGGGSKLSQKSIADIISEINRMRAESPLSNSWNVNRIGDQIIERKIKKLTNNGTTIVHIPEPTVTTPIPDTINTTDNSTTIGIPTISASSTEKLKNSRTTTVHIPDPTVTTPIPDTLNTTENASNIDIPTITASNIRNIKNSTTTTVHTPEPKVSTQIPDTANTAENSSFVDITSIITMNTEKPQNSRKTAVHIAETTVSTPIPDTANTTDNSSIIDIPSISLSNIVQHHPSGNNAASKIASHQDTSPYGISFGLNPSDHFEILRNSTATAKTVVDPAVSHLSPAQMGLELKTPPGSIVDFVKSAELPGHKAPSPSASPLTEMAASLAWSAVNQGIQASEFVVWEGQPSTTILKSAPKVPKAHASNVKSASSVPKTLKLYASNVKSDSSVPKTLKLYASNVKSDSPIPRTHTQPVASNVKTASIVPGTQSNTVASNVRTMWSPDDTPTYSVPKPGISSNTVNKTIQPVSTVQAAAQPPTYINPGGDTYLSLAKPASAEPLRQSPPVQALTGISKPLSAPVPRIAPISGAAKNVAAIQVAPSAPVSGAAKNVAAAKAAPSAPVPRVTLVSGASATIQAGNKPTNSSLNASSQQLPPQAGATSGGSSGAAAAAVKPVSPELASGAATSEQVTAVPTTVDPDAEQEAVTQGGNASASDFYYYYYYDDD